MATPVPTAAQNLSLGEEVRQDRGGKWWQTGVIYQIYPRSFQDSTGNGVGDLAGILDRLDYLNDTLGIDAIWLSPFYPSPMADFGYDVSDYTDVHSLFGDLDTFDRLLAEIHDRDLKLLVDFVPNHSSDQHPWFIESRSSKDDPKRDWYVWRDPKPDGSPPNNWLSVFGGSAWEWNEATGQYYLHSFLKEQPDLDWRNPEVEQAMLGAMEFWLERGVDGFRIDVAVFLMKDPQMRDNPLREDDRPDYHKAMGGYDSQIHLHDKDHPDIHAVFRKIRALLDRYSTRDQPRVSIGEIHEYDWPRWASYYGEDLDELHLPFNFSLLKADGEAEHIRNLVDNLEAAIPEGAWPNYVLGNHDETRLATRYGPDGSRVAALLLLTLRGTPTLYYGDEIGMTEADIPPERQQDPWGRREPGLGRDGCRTPMQWTDEPSAGFSEADPEALWLPVGDDLETVNVAVQRDDPDSLLNLYRRVLAFRKASPALQMGRYEPVESVPPDCFVYRRSFEDERLLVALNFGSESHTIALPGGFETATVVLATKGEREGTVISDSLTLNGPEGVTLAMAST